MIAGHGTICAYFFYDSLQGAEADVVGYGNDLVSRLGGTANELGGGELAVAKARMGMEVKNGRLPPAGL